MALIVFLLVFIIFGIFTLIAAFETMRLLACALMVMAFLACCGV